MIGIVESERAPRVLWVGDAAVASGFARCTHAVCDHLSDRDWDVRVLGMNYFGDPHPHRYPIYPCRQPLDGGRDNWGVTRLPRMIERLKPDVVVLLNDPWNVKPYLEAIEEYGVDRPPVVGWLAVDAANQDGQPLNELDHVVVWTKFAEDELRAGGYQGDCSVAPLGVDADLFYPRDRAEARDVVLPESARRDAFVVGVVGRNQPRKRLDLAIEYFARWVESESVDDAYLYLHVAPTGEAGFDVQRLARHHRLSGRVVLSQPPIGDGYPAEWLASLYSALDIYLTTTQGEGWGLPALEAMACGTPVVAPDWSGLGDWARDAAVLVECTSTAINAPLNALAYTVGGVPDKRETIVQLAALYVDGSWRQEVGERGRALARTLPWSLTAEKMRRVLESVVARGKKEAA